MVPENLDLLDGKLTSNESVEEELQLEDDIPVDENTLNEVSVLDDLMAHEKLIEEKQFKNKKIEENQTKESRLERRLMRFLQSLMSRRY